MVVVVQARVGIGISMSATESCHVSCLICISVIGDRSRFRQDPFQGHVDDPVGPLLAGRNSR